MFDGRQRRYGDDPTPTTRAHRGNENIVKLERDLKVHPPNAAPVVGLGKGVPHGQRSAQIVDHDIDRCEIRSQKRCKLLRRAIGAQVQCQPHMSASRTPELLNE